MALLKKKQEAPAATDEAAKDAATDGATGGEGAAEGGEAAPAPKSKKKLLIIAIAAVVVLAGAGAGLYFSGMLGGHGNSTEAVEMGADGKPIENTVYYTLPEFLINLNTAGKQASFLKTTLILELPKQSDVALVEANLPRLQDTFNTYLRELRSSDLAGSAGIQRLREELLLRANKALAPVKINDVLFKEVIVQ